MILVALLLAAVGAADVARWQRLEPSVPPILRASLVGAAAWSLLVVGTGLPPGYHLGAALAPAWVLATTRWRARISLAPVVVLATLVGAGAAASGLTPPAAGLIADWYATLPAAPITLDRFLVLAAAVLFAVESGNVVVRAVLVDTGTVASPDDEAVKGGRIIGPIERVFILAMALLGQYLAIGAIITAKSILRFPEIGSADVRTPRLLSARGRSRTRRKTAEYVLVGSLVSWAVALVLALLVAITP